MRRQGLYKVPLNIQILQSLVQTNSSEILCKCSNVSLSDIDTSHYLLCYTHIALSCLVRLYVILYIERSRLILCTFHANFVHTLALLISVCIKMANFNLILLITRISYNNLSHTYLTVIFSKMSVSPIHLLHL